MPHLCQYHIAGSDAVAVADGTIEIVDGLALVQRPCVVIAAEHHHRAYILGTLEVDLIGERSYLL